MRYITVIRNADSDILFDLFVNKQPLSDDEIHYICKSGRNKIFYLFLTSKVVINAGAKSNRSGEINKKGSFGSSLFTTDGMLYYSLRVDIPNGI